MATNDGGPAFPVPASDAENAFGEMAGNGHQPGMSLRDWFAGQALSSALEGTASDIAGACYALADAMLAVRDRRPQ